MRNTAHRTSSAGPATGRVERLALETPVNGDPIQMNETVTTSPAVMAANEDEFLKSTGANHSSRFS